jgi:hypothetical protein
MGDDMSIVIGTGANPLTWHAGLDSPEAAPPLLQRAMPSTAGLEIGLVVAVAAGLLLALLALTLCRGARAESVRNSASETLLPLTTRASAILPRVGSSFRLPRVGSSVFRRRSREDSTERGCLPCTCDCGGPLCEPAPCSRAAEAEALKQLAELEAAFAADERIGEMVRV